MKEIWKDIEGYEGLYQVSNFGKVRSLDRYDSRGRWIKGCILEPTNCKGYLQIVLFLNGKKSYYYIHRIVAEAFLPNPDNKPEIDHISTDKTDNTVCLNEDGSVNYDKTNLRWVTHTENMNNPLTRKKQSTRFKGKIGHNTPASKIIAQLDKNGKLLKVWLCAMDAVRQEGYTQEHISSCCKGTLKTHKGYKWQYIDDYLSDWLEQEIQI